MSLIVSVSYEPDGSPSLRDRKLEIKVRPANHKGEFCIKQLAHGLSFLRRS